MGGIGFKEILLILLVVVLVFGAKRLPELGESIGKAIKGFKRGIKTEDDIEVNPKSKQLNRGERVDETMEDAKDTDYSERK